MIALKHHKTADRLDEIAGKLEGSREDIAEVIRFGDDGSRNKVLTELANIVHEVSQALHAVRTDWGRMPRSR